MPRCACGEEFSQERADLGHSDCLACGDARASEEAEWRAKTAIPAYNKGPLMAITGRTLEEQKTNVRGMACKTESHHHASGPASPLGGSYDTYLAERRAEAAKYETVFTGRFTKRDGRLAPVMQRRLKRKPKPPV